MRFGCYTSIEVICEAMFTTHDAISSYQTYYQCPDNHQQLYSRSHTIYLPKGRSPFKSTAEWMQTNSQQGTNRCEMCDKTVIINISFIAPPPLVILEFSRSEIDIDDSFEVSHLGKPHKYNLAGVVYYKHAEQHFVSNIVTPDKQLWSYDGMRNGGRMSCLGPLATRQPAMWSRGVSESACAAFYYAVALTHKFRLLLQVLTIALCTKYNTHHCSLNIYISRIINPKGNYSFSANNRHGQMTQV